MPFAFVLTALGLGLMIWLTRHSFAAPVLFIFGAILIGPGVWMRSRFLRWYRRATWVLENVVPVPRTARFRTVPRVSTGVDHMVALLRPGAAPAAEPEVEYQIVDPQWSSYLTQPVQAYFDPEPAGPVVLRSANGLLWPHAVRRIELRRGGLQDR
jgi:hypothetical protein